jgi:hypothetical protein
VPRFIIDFFGLTEKEARISRPALFQHLYDRVYPERKHNKRAAYREKWWIFAEPRPAMRQALSDLSRFIATPYTAKHRPFVFVNSDTLPDAMIYAIASDDASILGVLSSALHSHWAQSTGGTLEDRPRYNSRATFFPFPFPVLSDVRSEIIRQIAEQLDAHRKRQQAAHPELTLTGMYNVLDKLRSGEVLSAKERTIHEHGLVSVLRQLHDEIDAAVLEAYGWSDLLPLLRVAMGTDAHVPVGAHPVRDASCDATGSRTEPAPDLIRGYAPAGMPSDAAEAKRAFDEAILERLVALNAERAAEEARGLVRWLRPEFQHPVEQATARQEEMLDAVDDVPAAVATSKPQPWPKDAVAQVRAVAEAIAASPLPLSVDELATRFSARGAWKKRLPQLLDMLVALGRAHEQDGRYSSH